MSTEVITQQPNQGFMQVSTIEQAMTCAELISKSSFCPKQMIGRSGDIVIALQMGQELGLKPMQALQNIAVINGRPSLWGDAMLAVCRQSPDFEYIKEEYMEESKTYVCRVKRRNEPEFIQSFSEADARLAKLWGKDGPWTTYPRRMLQNRARGFALRDAFPDLLRGIITQEEAKDMPRDIVDYSNVGVTIDMVHQEGWKIDESKLSVLKDKMTEAESKEIDICHFLKVDNLEEMNMVQFQQVCKMLERKIKQKRKVDNLDINKLLKKQEDAELDSLLAPDEEIAE